MTTAIIGTGGIGSVIARHLALGGEPLRLSSADKESARTLAAKVGRATVVAADNRDALRGVGATVLALRFTVWKSVVGQRPPDRAHSRIRRHMTWSSGDLRPPGVTVLCAHRRYPLGGDHVSWDVWSRPFLGTTCPATSVRARRLPTYNGYWYRGRPTMAELRVDRRACSRTFGPTSTRRLRGWDVPVQSVRLSATMLSVDAEHEDRMGRADSDWLACYAEYTVREQSGQELPV